MYDAAKKGVDVSSDSRWCKLQIVIPVYNDWDSVRRLLPLLDDELGRVNTTADVLLVDDGSSEQPATPWQPMKGSIRSVRILRLRRNLGHQRAICVGLCHLNEQAECTQVLVMDGDGEDAPEDVSRLLEECDRNPDCQVVFAERRRRSEGVLFSLCYWFYRTLHLVLVGHRVRVGNFSVIKRQCLAALCVSPDLWNHYAAAVFTLRLPMVFVPTDRGVRLAGRSKMNFSALIMHGLSALSVFADRLGTRLLIFSGCAAAASFVVMVGIAVFQMPSGDAVNSGAIYIFGLATIVLTQVVTFMLMFCFSVLGARALNSFIPLRDCHVFCQGVHKLWCADE